MGIPKQYYLGLDIGTDSVGYAVTDQEYALCKFKGDLMWGTHLFESGNELADRRLHRTNRRRINRRQQRADLVAELFAKEILKIDPNFFLRRKESALFSEDAKFGVKIFSGEGITDKAYHRQYPTIHHLILDLMTSQEPHDVRLVYLACSWLVTHRGHFLFDFGAEQTDQLLDFGSVYGAFCNYLEDQGFVLPWPDSVCADTVLDILQMDAGVRKKEEAFKTKVFGRKKPPKERADELPFSPAGIVTLLSGGTVKVKDLFDNDDYEQTESVSLKMGEEDFDRVVSELGDDGELLRQLRSIDSCAKLIQVMKNCRKGDPVCISSSKVAIYEQHKKDLELLKQIVKKYCPKQYNDIFRKAVADNYVAYSGNTKSCAEPEKVKGADKVKFSDSLKKKLSGLKVTPSDKAGYEDMMNRLDSYSFLPKQRDSDNRVIPQQLYRQELAAILKQAENYLPILTEQDSDGLTVSAKLLSIFDFRIPYYVGPLVQRPGSTAWIVRKQGKILPWNFEQMVDLDKSEQAFIGRMTNRCTYLPGEDVLPLNSLLYESFTVLNALNNLTLNGREFPREVKQELYTQLFQKEPIITAKRIREYLLQHGHIGREDHPSGLDVTFKSGLYSYHIFKSMLDKELLTEAEVERIILHAAYTEDKSRMGRWLKETFPQLPDEDVSYILKKKLKGFGRLSRKLLTELPGTERDSFGESFTIIETLWNTSCNLMQILSDRYTFADQIRDYCTEYYSEHPRKLTDRLSEMYVSNAVKRPIFRTLDIVSDVVKAAGGAPEKIFVEMSRGSSPDQKGKRTQSRYKQLLELYKRIKTDDAKQLAKSLEDMGANADNRLQSRDLYLYYLQMGKCAYTGEPIDLSRLGDGTYNREHIYPQCIVKDDSLLNNMVLVKSKENGVKDDTYPLDAKIRSRMGAYWAMLKQNGLMTEEKFRRLTRSTPFTADEKLGFINRQLVETRQSTKAIAALLQERFPNTEIVYVKAGLVSEFRQEFDMLKCRAVNDLHHAKDAYLNIVVGNVYHERFTRKWFRLDESYNVQVKKIFTHQHSHGGECYWNGQTDLAQVRKYMDKNAVHLTRYAFYRKGGLFNQQPEKAGKELVKRKQNLPSEKYGGYNKATASFFMLVRFVLKGKREVMPVPVELLAKEQVLADRDHALSYLEKAVEKIIGQQPEALELLLNGRPLKTNTVFSFDGTKMALAGKSSGGKNVLLSPLAALVLPKKWEQYAKRLEAFRNKQQLNKNIVPDEIHDGISKEKNMELYRILADKLGAWPFAQFPGNQADTLVNGVQIFSDAAISDQVTCLMNILQMMGSGSTAVDLRICGGNKATGSKVMNAKLSNWQKHYTDVRIIDESASGLFCHPGGNLLELL